MAVPGNNCQSLINCIFIILQVVDNFYYMFYMRHLLVFIKTLLLFISFSKAVNAQEAIDEYPSDLLESYEAYFENSRETIHLHLNKTAYAAGENIWFAAYIYDQKQNKISNTDTYIYVLLLDESGNQIAEKTIWYKNGFGYGEIVLEEFLESGDYYLQAFSRKMNIFQEDDSSLYPIKIINFENQILPKEAVASDSLIIDIQPEGGDLLEGIFGTCAIKFRNTNGLAVQPDSVFLVTAQQRNPDRISINEFGLGRFSMIPKIGNRPFIRAYHKRAIYEIDAPAVSREGYMISTDHYFNKKKLLVAVAGKSVSERSNKDELSLFIHKHGNYYAIPVTLDKTTLRSEISIPYNELFPGINTIVLINGQDKILAQRLVFIPHKGHINSRLLNYKKTKDSIVLYLGNDSEYNNQIRYKASISALPQDSRSLDQKISMHSRFYFNKYLDYNDITFLEKSNFLTDRSALFNIDALLILAGRDRYKWNRQSKYTNPAQQDTYPLYDLQGYVNLFGAKNESLEVLLYSTENRVIELSPLDQDGRFHFKKLSLAKNSKISLTVLNKKKNPIYANFFYTIHPGSIVFRHLWEPKFSKVRSVEWVKSDTLPDLFKEAEQLEEVVVFGDKLSRQKFFGKFNGRKIDAAARASVTLENFIRTYGYMRKYLDYSFYDPRRAGTWQLYRTCDLVSLYPAISFNGNYTPYIMEYSHVSMDYIDEVYYLKNSRCDPGIFVVFTNDKYNNRSIAERDKTSKEFTLDIGYDRPSPFERPDYYSLESSAYKHYGTVSWVPDLVSNKLGVYSLKIPNDKSSSLKLFLEGFDASGAFFSQTLDIDLSK